MVNLETRPFSENQLRGLPARIRQLTSLQTLAIDNNNNIRTRESVVNENAIFSEILDELSSLTSLQKIYIDEGQEDIIPPDLKDFIVVVEEVVNEED